MNSENLSGPCLSLYRGPLLVELNDSWLDAPRAELEELYITTLECLAGRTSPREAVHWLRKAVDSDPYRENLQQKLLIKLAECGDYSGLQVAFRSFRERLHRELNITPSHETERLYRSLISIPPKALTTSAPPLIRSRLPVPATEILGREIEIRHIGSLIKCGRLVTLLGPGGSGKTRLAIAVASEELGSFQAGVWFIDLSSVTDPAKVSSAVARSLGFQEQSGMSVSETIVEGIAETQRLLILDNCEHQIEASAQIANQLLAQCPQLKIIATSRIPLSSPGEQRYEVPPLALPSASEGRVSRSPALVLFEARARLVSPSFSIDPSNAHLVASICKQVDALPLGIEMAAARLGALSLNEVDKRLIDKFSFLKDPGRSASSRHKTLGAVIQWSYDLLGEPARTLMKRLTAFEGGWTLGAAETVCGFGILETKQVLDALINLTEASLVKFSDGRYSFLETISQFARAQFEDDAEWDQTKSRHFEFYAKFLNSVEARIAAQGPDKAASHYGPELQNIRSALGWSVEVADAEIALRIVADASLVFSILQLDREAAEWLEQILALKKNDSTVEARILALRRACRFYKSIHAHLDRSTASANTLRACEELIHLASETGDLAALADGLYERAGLLPPEKSDEAIHCLERSLEIGSALPGGGNGHWPMRAMGHRATNAGDFEAANHFFARAAEQAKRANDVGAVIDMLQSGSHLLREQCAYEGALSKLVEADRIARGWGDARASAFVHLRLAELFLESWQFDKIMDPLLRARAFYEESHSRFHEMLVDGLSRYVAAHEGRTADAVNGLSNVTSKLLDGAMKSHWAWWHGMGIEMEALGYSLSRSGDPMSGAVLFGAAKALRHRDKALLSPSVEHRWRCLSEAAGFGQFEAQVTEGSALSPEEILVLAGQFESDLLRKSSVSA